MGTTKTVNVVTMDDILRANIGESRGTLAAQFKKTVNIRQYESETVVVNAELTLDYPIGSPERTLITSILMAQVEYAAMCQLSFKGQMGDQDFYERRSQLEAELQSVLKKTEMLAGKDLSHILKATGNAVVNVTSEQGQPQAVQGQVQSVQGQGQGAPQSVQGQGQSVQGVPQSVQVPIQPIQPIPHQVQQVPPAPTTPPVVGSDEIQSISGIPGVQSPLG